MKRVQPAFTLIEVVVAIALMVTLAAVLVPGLVRALDRTRLDRAEDSLLAMTEAIYAFHGSGIGVYPGTVIQLTRVIGAGDLDSCGNPYSAKQAMTWDGPYLNRMVPAGGIPVGVGTAQTGLSRAGTLLRIVVDDVTEEDALALDRRVDGEVADPAADGTVRWTAGAEPGLVTLYWTMPVAAC